MRVQKEEKEIYLQRWPYGECVCECPVSGLWFLSEYNFFFLLVRFRSWFLAWYRKRMRVLAYAWLSSILCNVITCGEHRHCVLWGPKVLCECDGRKGFQKCMLNQRPTFLPSPFWIFLQCFVYMSIEASIKLNFLHITVFPYQMLLLALKLVYFPTASDGGAPDT